MAASADGRSEEQGIAVVARIRPLASAEVQAGERVGLEWDKRSITCSDRAKTRKVDFDHVYGTDATNTDIYTQAVAPVVQRCLEGYNGTVFAYGQTGSGKTYTILGHGDTKQGVLPLAVQHVFSQVHAEAAAQRDAFFSALSHAGDSVSPATVAAGVPRTEFRLSVSYLEVYQEEVHDLLQTGAPPPMLPNVRRQVLQAISEGVASGTPSPPGSRSVSVSSASQGGSARGRGVEGG